MPRRIREHPRFARGEADDRTSSRREPARFVRPHRGRQPGSAGEAAWMTRGPATSAGARAIAGRTDGIRPVRSLPPTTSQDRSTRRATRSAGCRSPRARPDHGTPGRSRSAVPHRSWKQTYPMPHPARVAMTRAFFQLFTSRPSSARFSLAISACPRSSSRRSPQAETAPAGRNASRPSATRAPAMAVRTSSGAKLNFATG